MCLSEYNVDVSSLESCDTHLMSLSVWNRMRTDWVLSSRVIGRFFVWFMWSNFRSPMCLFLQWITVVCVYPWNASLSLSLEEFMSCHLIGTVLVLCSILYGDCLVQKLLLMILMMDLFHVLFCIATIHHESLDDARNTSVWPCVCFILTGDHTMIASTFTGIIPCLLFYDRFN